MGHYRERGHSVARGIDHFGGQYPCQDSTEGELMPSMIDWKSYIAPGYKKKNWCGTCAHLDQETRRCIIPANEKVIEFERFWVEGPKNRNLDQRVDSCDHWEKLPIAETEEL
jgi:hypothetical protein